MFRRIKWKIDTSVTIGHAPAASRNTHMRFACVSSGREEGGLGGMTRRLAMRSCACKHAPSESTSTHLLRSRPLLHHEPEHTKPPSTPTPPPRRPDRSPADTPQHKQPTPKPADTSQLRTACPKTSACCLLSFFVALRRRPGTPLPREAHPTTIQYKERPIRSQRTDFRDCACGLASLRSIAAPPDSIWTTANDTFPLLFGSGPGHISCDGGNEEL